MPNYHPAPLAPLRSVDAYTSWPGGVDPSVMLYKIQPTTGGRHNRTRKAKRSRKAKRNGKKSASRKQRR